MKPHTTASPSKKPNTTKSNGSPASKKATSSTTAKQSSGLHTLFVDQLKDIYWAEKTLTKEIPKMAKKATDEDLISALESHLEETKQQVIQCEEVFSLLNMKPQAKVCEAMQGLLEEAKEIMDETEEGSVRDAGIICAAQKIEHYEIATYGCLVAFARKLNQMEAAEILEGILEEEKNADSKLTEVAETAVNDDASDEEE